MCCACAFFCFLCAFLSVGCFFLLVLQNGLSTSPYVKRAWYIMLNSLGTFAPHTNVFLSNLFQPFYHLIQFSNANYRIRKWELFVLCVCVCTFLFRIWWKKQKKLWKTFEKIWEYPQSDRNWIITFANFLRADTNHNCDRKFSKRSLKAQEIQILCNFFHFQIRNWLSNPQCFYFHRTNQFQLAV